MKVLSPGKTQIAVARAFDSLAPEYDTLWTSSITGTLQRDAVWRTIDRCFRPGDLVMDLGAGTGIDAVHLARRGVRVHALEISPEMARAASNRAASERLSDAITIEPRAIEGLASLPSDRPLDGVFSNFGAMNCVGDIAALGRELRSRMRPGGILVLCVMGRFCAWETLWYLVRGNLRKAFRRLAGRSAASLGPSKFEIRYPTSSQLAGALRESFRLLSISGVGLLVPPSCAERWAARHPGLVRRFAAWDRILGGLPVLRALSDHRVCVFVRR